MNLSNEIVYEVLSYCDSMSDYQVWSLVCHQFNDLIYGARENIIKTRLNKEIDIMLPNSKGWRYKYIPHPNNKVVLRFLKSYNSICFLNWGTHPIVTDMMFYIKDKETFRIVGHNSWNIDHPYNFGSKMPKFKNTGYLCVNYMGKADKVVMQLDKNKAIEPLLIAWK